MTQIGKCDICRQRKVKCDERKPNCGQCMKKNRPCRYGYGKVSKFVDESSRLDGIRSKIHLNENNDLHSTSSSSEESPDTPPELSDLSEHRTILSVRSAKGAKAGQGVFHTLTPVRLNKNGLTNLAGRRRPPSQKAYEVPSFLYVPQCPESSLRYRFVEVLGVKPMEWNPTFLWGLWVACVPSRIGISPAMDDAISCFMAGSIAHSNHNEANVSAARKQYTKALSSLRTALTGDVDVRLSTETLAAVKLLSAFEIFMGIGTNRWVSHSHGLTRLLVARGPSTQGQDMDRSLFYSSLMYEFSESILNGSDSAFDSPGWLYYPPPVYPNECPTFETACKVIMQQMVRIPRLTRLVRELRQDPLDLELGSETLQLAEKLYQTQLDVIIGGALQTFSTSVPTHEDPLSEYVPESLEFSSLYVFENLTRYWYCRIFILGLCQALHEIFPFSSIFDPVRMREEELRAAEYIAMSAQYAEQLWDPMPLGPLLIILPLQLSFGAWWRCERSEDEDISEELRRKASFMKWWSMDKSNQMLRVWGGGEMEILKMEVESASFEGGPLMPWMKRHIKSEEVY